MGDVSLVRAVKPAAWRPQKGESLEDWVAFIWWALADGKLRNDLAQDHDWAHRRQVLETYEVLAEIPAGQAGQESAISRVRIVLAEIKKLEAQVLSTPNQVLEHSEIFKGVDWMMTAAEGMAQRAAAQLDWSSLDPEEREIMLKAKRIQDRLLQQRQ